MEAQTIFSSLFCSPPSPILVSIYQGACSISLVPSLHFALLPFSLPISSIRVLRRRFFLTDFLFRFLLTVLRRFPRKIMRSQK